MSIAWAIVASGIGAVARHAIDGEVMRRTDGTFPWGTAVVNVLGAVLLGLLVALHGAGRLGDGALAVAGVGFCGGFSTFSAWMVETIQLQEDADHWPAIANLAGMVAAGVVGVAAGSALG